MQAGSRKLHVIANQGRALLAAKRPALDALLERVEAAGRAGGEGPLPQVLRAMENVKLALRLRLALGWRTSSRATSSASRPGKVGAPLDARGMTAPSLPAHPRRHGSIAWQHRTGTWNA